MDTGLFGNYFVGSPEKGINEAIEVILDIIYIYRS
jgi:hypothetical protein